MENPPVSTSSLIQWHRSDHIHTAGYLFDEAGKLWKNESLPDFFAQISSAEQLEQKLQKVTGSFACIIRLDGLSLAATDCIRSIPIWYNTKGNISHDIQPLLPSKAKLQHDFFPAFLHACFVPSHYTLVDHLFQLQAGEILVVEDEKIDVRVWFSHRLRPQHEMKELKARWQKMISRLIGSAQGQTFIIPLSGGYDSRFLAASLHEFGYEKVKCFTYGRPKSFEVEISRQVAEALGYEWAFVEYDEALMQRYVTETGRAYRDAASAYSQLAHEQDFFAVWKLKEEGWLPDDAVFVPGFGGDVLGGSWSLYVQNEEDFSVERVADFLLAHPKFFNEADEVVLNEDFLRAVMLDELGERKLNNLADFYGEMQYWGVRNRMSKFLVNAVRVYDFWGYEWRLPFWDREWAEWWYGVPLEWRFKKKLYLSFARQELFGPKNIDFIPLDTQPTPQWKQVARNVLKGPIKRFLKRQLAPKNDINNQLALSKVICEQLGDLSLMHPYRVNYLMAKWYLGEI